MANKIKKIETPDLNQIATVSLLGAAIKARRTQSNLRLEDAAALCGVAKQTLMMVEHGNANSQISTVLGICSALGIKLYIEPWYSPEVSNDWQ